MTAYLATNVLFFAFLCFVWKRSDWLNVTIKFTFLGMTAWSAFLLASHLGYVVKGG